MINEEKLDGWEKTTLGNIADYINGRAFKPTEWQSTGIPIIRIQNWKYCTDIQAINSGH